MPPVTEAVLAELRGEMREGFASLRGELRQLAAVYHQGRDHDTQGLEQMQVKVHVLEKQVQQHAQILSHWRGWITGAVSLGTFLGWVLAQIGGPVLEGIFG